MTDERETVTIDYTVEIIYGWEDEEWAKENHLDTIETAGCNDLEKAITEGLDRMGITDHVEVIVRRAQ